MFTIAALMDGSQRLEPSHSLVSAAVCAVAANQEVVAGVDEHPVFRNTFFTLEKGEASPLLPHLIIPVALAI